MLVPESRPVVRADLVGLYDWPAATWLRTCMVIGLDGGIAGPDGLSASISSPADRAVLAAVRAHSDAYLVGAATVRAEGYRPVVARPGVRQVRVAAGQRPAPTLAVVSGSCRFDWGRTTFQGSAEPPVILTGATSDPGDRAAARDAGCEVLVVGDGPRVDLPSAVAALRDRGLGRITAEGGPELLAQLVAEDLVDEVDLTLSPTLVAGPRPASAAPAVLHRLALHQLLVDDGYLFTRYLRTRGAR
jgi:riboflavin biosynthesis pyrimidine reductase